jgi:hypothetical protein
MKLVAIRIEDCCKDDGEFCGYVARAVVDYPNYVTVTNCQVQEY